MSTYAIKIDGRTHLVDQGAVIKLDDESAQQIIDIQNNGGDPELLEIAITDVILDYMGG